MIIPLEQDYRGIKGRYGPKRGFEKFASTGREEIFLFLILYPEPIGQALRTNSDFMVLFRYR